MWRQLKSLIGGAHQDTIYEPESERRVWVRRSCDFDAYLQPVALDLGGLGDRQAARVRNISRGGMNIVVSQPLESGSHISVELPGDEGQRPFTVLACVVHAVPQSGGGWALGCSFAQELTDDDLRPFGARRLRPAPTDQRAWERFPVRTEATYAPLRAPHMDPRDAVVADLSANGVGLLVETEFDVGTLLNLHLRRTGAASDLEILACVVRVSPQEDGKWLLGCNFISELSDEQIATLC